MRTFKVTMYKAQAFTVLVSADDEGDAVAKAIAGEGQNPNPVKGCIAFTNSTGHLVVGKKLENGFTSGCYPVELPDIKLERIQNG